MFVPRTLTYSCTLGHPGYVDEHVTDINESHGSGQSGYKVGKVLLEKTCDKHGFWSYTCLVKGRHMPSRPVALRFASSLHFLKFLLQDRHEIKHAVLCSSRESFVQELIELINALDPNGIQRFEQEHLMSLLRYLITPNLNNIALIRNVSVVFTPTLAQLRAYLSSGRLNFISPCNAMRTGFSTIQPSQSLIAIYGSLNLHYGISEFSAQGLSRTMSLTVEATRLAGAGLLMAECDRTAEQNAGEDSTTPFTDTLISPFAMRVPVLNRITGHGRDERFWAGKIVQVGRIWARWCHIT